jgi:hypothetical protein
MSQWCETSLSSASRGQGRLFEPGVDSLDLGDTLLELVELLAEGTQLLGDDFVVIHRRNHACTPSVRHANSTASGDIEGELRAYPSAADV